jgi:hypothetical protein
VQRQRQSRCGRRRCASGCAARSGRRAALHLTAHFLAALLELFLQLALLLLQHARIDRRAINARGETISDKKPNSVNFAVWWDGDLLRELLNGNTVSKWDWLTETTNLLFTATKGLRPRRR